MKQTKKLLAMLMAVCMLVPLFGLSALAADKMTNDPGSAKQWGMKAIGMEQAWRSGLTGNGVKVGVIDCGLSTATGDIARSRVEADKNHTGSIGDSATDIEGHGTFVAGIIGAGKIARKVIRIAQAMDMKVLCHARKPRENEVNLTFVPLEQLLRESDFVTIHCPLTPQTRHLIDEKALAIMKPSAFLINTARGAIVDEAALIRALENGQIAGAGLDVQETEPPAENNPLYTLDNVIITPHMGWKGMETRQRLVGVIAENIRSFFDGSPVNVVSD